MRKIYNIYVLLVAVVAMAFTSCQGDDNNLDASNRRGATTFTANFDASRSYFGEKVDGAYPSYWSGDDRVMLEIIDSEFLSIRPSESIAMDIVDEAGKYASFTATIEQEFNGGSVYAYVPAASWEYGTDSWGISSYFYKLPTTQTPTATSVDPAAHILRAECGFEGALPTNVDLTFEHVAAYGKLSIPALEGEDVQSVQIDLTGAWGTEYSYTLNVSELDEPTYWFACESDVIMAIGITAVTADKSYTYERTFESGSEVLFSIGHVRPLTIAGELIDPSQPEPTYPNREIHYTATAKVEANSIYPWSFDTFGANILSHDFNEESGEGVITFDADVTTIGNRAFYYCDSLTSVTIPDSVTTIGEGAFYNCDSLTSVTIPDSVTTIGDHAFCNCDSLTEFNGKFASEDGRCLIVDGTLNSFAPAGLTSYTIPDSVTTIGNYAFQNCISLTSITIGDSVTTIGDFAFEYCSSLTSVTIGDSVTTIGDYAFYKCNSLTSVTIPDSVTTIGGYAFWYCSNLTSVYCEATTPPSLVGSSVFDYNASGRTIYVPAASVEAYKSAEGWSEYADAIVGYDFESGEVVEPEVNEANRKIHYTATAKVEAHSDYPWTFDTFGANILSHDYNAETGEGVITFDADVTTIGARAFYNSDSLTSVTIPDSVTTIGNSAFYGCDSLTSVTIGDSVTTIGNSAFYNCSSLTSVTIGDSVTTIGGAAFEYCSSLTSVTIGDSVTTIGGAAFEYCSSLTSVTIPDSVTTIGDYAFHYCSALSSFNGKFASTDGRCLIIDNILVVFAPAGLSTYTIPSGVTTIGKCAFRLCESIEKVVIPNSVTLIQNSAFQACKGLIEVVIPDSVTVIEDSAFWGCTSLPEVTIPDSVTTLGNTVFNFSYALWTLYCESVVPPTAGTELLGLKDSRLSIFVPAESVDAYKSASGWSEYADYIVGYDFESGDVVEPEGNEANRKIHYTATAKVEAYSIYPWLFGTFGANVLSHDFNEESGEGVITFDADVTTIGKGAFYSCSSLTSITIPDSVTTIGDSAFYCCDSLTEFNGKFASEDGRCLIVDGTLNSFAPAGLTSYTIPDSVTTIGERAFISCSKLTSITILDSVTTIGERAFAGCDGLTSITIPDGVTTIGNYAFYNCGSLTSITIPDGVTTIGKEAFYDCDSLTSITIPDSVTAIGYAAFRECDSLTSITIPDSVTTIGDYAFYGCDSLTSVTIGDSVTTIGARAFCGCSILTSVTIGDSVTTIGNSAFADCDSLTSITIPDSVTTIGDNAFTGCISLTSVTIGDSVTTIGNSAFSHCYGLTSVTIGNSVTTIGESAFADCYSLTSITIPDSVTTIGKSAFYNCSSLTSVTIGDSVTTIEKSAFADCDSLMEFKGKFASEDGRCLIVDGTLNLCAPAGLTSYTIPDSVTTIGRGAFAFCGSLTSVTIPDSVTTIGDNAFYYCVSLTSVYCEATTPPSLGGGYVFDNNASGRTIYVPAASVEAYKSTARWSEYADAIVGNGPTPEDTPITDISSPSLKVGDFVSLDGVLGIVYYNDSSVVKVMSVETTTCEWGLYGTSVGATDPDNGRVNVATVKANGCFDFLPGFVWCESLGEGWYFPTIVEMIELYDAKETMNASLSAYGYPQFEGYYWASSEYSSTNAAQFIAASCSWSSCSKSDATNKVCAIRVVNL